MAHICLVLTAKTIDEDLEIIRDNYDSIDMVELRTDLLDQDQYSQVARFPSLTDLPVILTCRKDSDGGSWKGHERDRTGHLLDWLDGEFSYVDLEMDLENSEIEKKTRSSGIQIIRSFHDFHGVPENLFEIMNSLRGTDVIAKGAVYPRSSEELHRLIDASIKLKKSGKVPFILLGMGDFGFPTRILAEKLGSYLTFCSDSAAPSGAPGHCSASDLSEIYHFRQISDKTTVNSIIGNPVKQSRSPHIHNKGYREKNIDAVYVPFLTDSLPWFMKIADLLTINGSSVTVPFKSEIIPLIDSADKAVKKIGACNTIFRDEKGRWAGTNTDTYGLIKPLLDFLEISDLSGWKVSVIGAGGAARAAVFALQEKGAEVAVFNRTLSRGVELAEELKCRAFALDQSSEKELREYSSVIVQTTNAGMAPLEDINPLKFYPFDGSEVVYDIIYKPEKTLLMKKAREAGCRTLGGYRMLEEQAYLQFRLFTGVEY
ncbi:MAG: shikimate dehydrogenase [Spirochaetaceae bacterium]|nr:shikimate dehydrogenase [Spirochaetaceae bacterium]